MLYSRCRPRPVRVLIPLRSPHKPVQKKVLLQAFRAEEAYEEEPVRA